MRWRAHVNVSCRETGSNDLLHCYLYWEPLPIQALLYLLQSAHQNALAVRPEITKCTPCRQWPSLLPRPGMGAPFE